MLFGRSPLIHSSLVTLETPEDISAELPSNTVSSALMKSIIDHYGAFM